MFHRCSSHPDLGGVTSSSLEVLAGLSLSNDEYLDLMVFANGQPSAFYKSYVKDIQQKITENAAQEFQCLWREHGKTAKPVTVVSESTASTQVVVVLPVVNTTIGMLQCTQIPSPSLTQ